MQQTKHLSSKPVNCQRYSCFSTVSLHIPCMVKTSVRFAGDREDNFMLEFYRGWRHWGKDFPLWKRTVHCIVFKRAPHSSTYYWNFAEALTFIDGDSPFWHKGTNQVWMGKYSHILAILKNPSGLAGEEYTVSGRKSEMVFHMTFSLHL